MRKRALLVIDMQEIYVGKQHNRYFNYQSEDLIDKVNKVIREYDREDVIYIQNVTIKGMLDKFSEYKAEEGTKGTDLVEGMLVVSEHRSIKWRADAFTNPELDLLLKKKGMREVECIGIDGAACVPMTAMGAIKKGYRCTLRNEAIATRNEAGREKQNRKLIQEGSKNGLFEIV